MYFKDRIEQFFSMIQIPIISKKWTRNNERKEDIIEHYRTSLNLSNINKMQRNEKSRIKKIKRQTGKG